MLIILLGGCGVDSIENTESFKESVSESVYEMDSNEETETETESQVKEKEHEFVITLPEKTIIGENVDGMDSLTAWEIDVEGYEALDRYPYSSENFLWISAGWIDVYNGEYSYNVDGKPYFPWNHCSFYDYEEYEKYILCEVEFEVYSSEIYTQKDVEKEDGLSHFWCVIYENSSNNSADADTLLESNWIFLNKSCFTKEQAISIAENYSPSWE